MNQSRALILTTLLLATAFAGCLNLPEELENAAGVPPAVPGVDADGFAPRIVNGYISGILHATAEVGMSVHAETFIPEVATVLDGAVIPEGGFPTILVMSPYNGAGSGGNPPGHYAYGWLVKELVPRGYAVVVADLAGTGGSGGCWDFMGPDEQKSVVTMINTIAAQDWSNGKVGMIGKSYDGMTQIMGASHAPEALKTVVPVAALTHAYAGLYQNGIHYGGGWWATTTAYHSISASPPGDSPNAKWPGYAESVAKTPACIAQNTALGNDPTGAYNVYHQERDFRPMAKNVKASVFVMQGFLDGAVKPDNMFPWFTDLDVPKKAWIGHWGHDYANSTWAGRDDMYTTLHRWFDHWLMDIPNGMDQELGVDVQDSQGNWRREESWPPARANETTLYLGVDGLSSAPGSGAIGFGGPVSAVMSRAASIETQALEAPIHIAGIPTITLKVASDTAGGNVIARLVDVGPDGSERRITQGAMNLQFVNGLETPMPLVPTQPVTATFEFYPTDYVVAEGHMIRLDLDTQDPTSWYFIDPTTSTLTVYADASSITLPTVTVAEDEVFHVGCGTRVKDVTPDCWDGEMRDKDYVTE